MLIKPDLQQALADLPDVTQDIGLYCFDTTDSTNMQAGKLPEDTRLPVVVFANQQTAGRGRLGRSFASPRDGIYLSIVVKPNVDLNRASMITIAAAVAVAESIDEVLGKRKTSSIKWVNDIYLDNRKVCGILTEASTDSESGQLKRLIIGIGINTSTDGLPEELAGTAGAVPLHLSPLANAREELTASVINKTLGFIHNLEQTPYCPPSPDAAQPPAFLETYRRKSNLIGRTVTVYKGIYRKDPAQELGGRSARVLGIDDAGGLQVLYADGTRETLTTGEVSIRV